MGVNRTGVDQFQLRLPAGLRDRVKEKADANGRSANAEIVAAIEAALDAPDLSTAQLREMLDEERKASDRLERMVESLIETGEGMRDLIQGYRRQNHQQAGMIESLAGILLNLKSAPDAAVLDMASRLKGLAEALKKRLEGNESGES